MTTDTPTPRERIASCLCKSGKFETGQGTCAVICMSALGDPRKSGCGYATQVHGALSDAILNTGVVDNWVVEACRQRAIALFQSYATGVALSRRGDQHAQLVGDVEAFITELNAAYAPLKALSTPSPGIDLAEALRACVTREKEWANLRGFADCMCMALSRDTEREYETGKCPHQLARTALDNIGDGGGR